MDLYQIIFAGLVFNKLSDSCDYPRNVMCTKNKIKSITTVSTTTLSSEYVATILTTSERTKSAQNFQEFSDEINREDEYEYTSEELNLKNASSKTLQYHTITRNQPLLEMTTEQSSFNSKAVSDFIRSDINDGEDPQVIRELIELIKKAGRFCFINI